MPNKARGAPQSWGEDDRLAAPGVDTRTLLLLGAGFLVFVAVSLALLMVFFRHEVGADAFTPSRTFPDPRLETNIVPRSMADVARGPAAIPHRLPIATPNSAQDLQRAMQIVVATGARAYDAPAVGASPRIVETVETKTTRGKP
jgi:hypothetical protein